MGSLIFRSIVLLVGVLGNSAFGADKFFEYALSNYPKTSGSCNETAQLIGKKLNELTGKKVYQTRCESENRSGYAIVVTYLSDAALPLHSTAPTTSVLSQGVYASVAECNADLDNQVEFFKKFTTLNPIVNYCEHDLLSSDNPYYFRIEAFGQPTQSHFADSFSPQGDPLENPQLVEQEVFRTLQTMGVNIVQTKASLESGGMNRVAFHYYGTKRLRFKLWDFPQYDSRATCKAKVEEMRAAFKAVNVAVITAYCNPNFSTSHSHRIGVLYPDYSIFQIAIAPPKYDTIKDCDADRQRILEDYRKTLELDARTAVCMGYPKDVEMGIFIVPAAH